jgi:hypothetical protein
MVCLGNICVNTLHKGESIFTNNNNNNNNQNFSSNNPEVIIRGNGKGTCMLIDGAIPGGIPRK